MILEKRGKKRTLSLSPKDTFQTTAEGGKSRQSMDSLNQLNRTETAVQRLTGGLTLWGKVSEMRGSSNKELQ